MSMVCRVLGLTPAQADALRATPRLASDLVNVLQDRELAAETPPALMEQYRTQAEGYLGGKELAARMDDARLAVERLGPFEPIFDLDQSWDLLNTFFTEQVDAPNDAPVAGEELGDDLGYGPPRLHDQEATQDFASFLESLDIESLQDEMDDENAGEDDWEDAPDLDDEALAALPLLRDYVVRMAEKQNGLLIWLT